MTAACATCPYRHREGELLQCREGSPTPDPIQRFAVWPTVKPTDFCRHHPDFQPLAPDEAQPQLLL